MKQRLRIGRLVGLPGIRSIFAAVRIGSRSAVAGSAVGREAGPGKENQRNP